MRFVKSLGSKLTKLRSSINTPASVHFSPKRADAVVWFIPFFLFLTINGYVYMHTNTQIIGNQFMLVVHLDMSNAITPKAFNVEGIHNNSQKAPD